MDAVAEAMGAYGAALFPLRGQVPNFPHSRSLEPLRYALVGNGWIGHGEECAAIDIERIGFQSKIDFIAPPEIARYPYYQAFLAPHGLRWFTGKEVKTGGDQWYLSVQRTIDQGPFSLGEQEGLVALSEPLAIAVIFAHALWVARTEGALAAFEANGTAVVLFDHRGEVLRVNPSARRLFGPDLNILNRRLISADRDAAAAFDRALAELIWTPGAAARGPTIQFPRKNKRPIIVHPLRLPEVTSNAFSLCQAVAVLIDLDKRARPSECDLRACLGFTAAEASLAVQIACGENITAICKKKGSHGKPLGRSSDQFSQN